MLQKGHGNKMKKNVLLLNNFKLIQALMKNRYMAFQLFKDLFYLLQRQNYRVGEREREREVVQVLVHSQNGHNRQGDTGQSQEPRVFSGFPL